MRRCPRTHEFACPDFPAFRPNLSPEEVLRRGSFGGGYYRTIYSSVAGATLRADDALATSVRPEWIAGLDAARLLTAAEYDKSVNRYGVSCGNTLEYWETAGWIKPIDPYGWFQWYCRFFQGRRSTDDERQVARWAGVTGPKGRFRNQLINRCHAAGKRLSDRTVSPVIRQVLQHWGYAVDYDGPSVASGAVSEVGGAAPAAAAPTGGTAAKAKAAPKKTVAAQAAKAAKAKATPAATGKAGGAAKKTQAKKATAKPKQK